MLRLIFLVIAAAIIWVAYTNWGTPLNVDKAVKDGTSVIKTEKSINRVIDSRNNTAKDNKEALDRI